MFVIYISLLFYAIYIYLFDSIAQDDLEINLIFLRPN
jgi:hypothetical protein